MSDIDTSWMPEFGKEILKREDKDEIISHQKSEIERLKSMNQAKLDTIHDLMAEIKRLNGQLKLADNGLDTLEVLIQRTIKAAKQESYMELAEELKRHCSDIDSDNINQPNVRILWDAEATIDDVVKEMVGE